MSRLIGALSWLTQSAQEIQVLDYELHASLRILAAGEMDSEHLAAFLAAVTRRDRLMERVIAHCNQAK